METLASANPQVRKKHGDYAEFHGSPRLVSSEFGDYALVFVCFPPHSTLTHMMLKKEPVVNKKNNWMYDSILGIGLFSFDRCLHRVSHIAADRCLVAQRFKRVLTV